MKKRKHPIFENMTDDEVDKLVTEVLDNFPKHLPACGMQTTWGNVIEGIFEYNPSRTVWICDPNCELHGKVLQ